MKHIFVFCFVLLVSYAALEITDNYPPGESSQNDVYLESSQNGAFLGSSENFDYLGLFVNNPSGESSQNDAFPGSSQNDALLGFYTTIRLPEDDTSLKLSRFSGSPRFFRRNMLIDPINILNLLIRNLQKGAQEILNIVHVFSNDIIKEVGAIRKNVTNEMQKLRKQIMERLQKIPQTLYGIGASAKMCYNAFKADFMLNETANPSSCVEDEIQNVGDQLHALELLAADAIAGVAETIEDVKYCKDHSLNMLMMGVCLGETVLQTQMKTGAFLSKSALSIAHTNLVIASIPTRIEVCVGGRLAVFSSALLRAILDVTDCFSNEFVGLLANKK